MAQDVRYFQFLAGPRNGEVVIFDKIEEEDGIVFICFKDGSRCNEQLIVPLNSTNYVKELMAEVDSPTNLWTIKEEWVGRQEEKWVWKDETNPGLPEEKVCVQPFEPGKRKLTPIPPRPTKSKFGQINAFNTPVPHTNVSSIFGTETQQTSSSKPEQVNLGEDPVWMMCEKAKKFDSDISMTLRVSLPKKSLYNVAKESFEDGGQKVIEYIIHNLDDKSIKESLKLSLLEAYEDKKNYGEDTVKPSSGVIPYNPDTIEEPVIGGPVAEK
jgi:hypothetical protein